MKFKVIEYPVLEGDINNEPPIPKSIYKPYVSPLDNVITLPNQNQKRSVLIPTPQERFEIVKAAKELGFHVGVKVIRADQVTANFVKNPRMIGTLDKFLFTLYPGWAKYLPLLISFNSEVGYPQSFPFDVHEVELLDDALERLALEKLESVHTDSTMQDNIIADIMKEKHGVIPFIHPRGQHNCED